MDSCWGYSYKNSMTLRSLHGSNLLPPPGPPRVPEEAGRSFPGAEASEVLPHYLGATSNPGGREELPRPSGQSMCSSLPAVNSVSVRTIQKPSRPQTGSV